MSKKCIKTITATVLAVILSMTYSISAYAANLVWEFVTEPENSMHYLCQPEYAPHNNFAQSIIRSKTATNQPVLPYWMVICAYITDATTNQIVDTTGAFYNSVATSSMSFQATVTSAGYYEFLGYAGYYQHTNNDGSRTYLYQYLDAGTYTYVPGNYNNNIVNPAAVSADAVKTNSRGQTYGTIKDAQSIEDIPELIAARNKNGVSGYISSDVLFMNNKTEEELIDYMTAVTSGLYTSVPLYDLNGNIIDSFTLSNSLEGSLSDQ